MSDKRDWTGFISHSTAWLVAVLAVIAFTLSYNALQQVAQQNGIPERLSYAWPLLVDFALIVFSMAALTASLHNESTLKQWGLIALFTIATIGFNLIHAPANTIGQVVAIVAPVALFLSFETLMGMVKAGVRRKGLADALKTLTGQVDGLRGELSALDNERQMVMAEIANKRKELGADVKAARAKIDGLRQEYDNLLAEMQRLQVQPSPKQANLDALLTYLGERPQATLTQAASELGVSRQTVSNYAKELEQAGIIHRNGEGWKVQNDQ